MCHQEVRELLMQVEACIYKDRHVNYAPRDYTTTEISMMISKCLALLEDMPVNMQIVHAE